jgi:hypothetical protein
LLLPTFAAMLPGPPLAPRLRRVIFTLALPLPRFARKAPLTCTVPAPEMGSTDPPAIGWLRLFGFSFRPRAFCS